MKYYSASWGHWCLTSFEKLLEKKKNMTLLSGSEWKKELSVKVEKTDGTEKSVSDARECR